MKKAIIFDDRAMVLDQMGQKLARKGYSVSECSTCAEVIENIASATFDWYILDLNTTTCGLSNESAQKTCCGLRTGWVLLTDHILKQDEKNIDRVIFFSDYEKDLEAYLKSKEAKKAEKEWFEKLKGRKAIISKSDGYGALLSLIR
ncbi:MAG: hypothetical protein FWH55_12915 [Oscillospiraceae bacterium]|nr:hypothetical protein [Oscillospiraceae bacterium]